VKQNWSKGAGTLAKEVSDDSIGSFGVGVSLRIVTNLGSNRVFLSLHLLMFLRKECNVGYDPYFCLNDGEGFSCETPAANTPSSGVGRRNVGLC
jgi:hypothetical protein